MFLSRQVSENQWAMAGGLAMVNFHTEIRTSRAMLLVYLRKNEGYFNLKAKSCSALFQVSPALSLVPIDVGC